MIGAVTSNRSSRADRVPHANTSAATIARSDSLIVSPDTSSHRPAAAADEARRLAKDLIIEPDAIAVIVRDQSGDYHVHTRHHLVGGGATWGMFWACCSVCCSSSRSSGWPSAPGWAPGRGACGCSQAGESTGRPAARAASRRRLS